MHQWVGRRVHSLLSLLAQQLHHVLRLSFALSFSISLLSTYADLSTFRRHMQVSMTIIRMPFEKQQQACLTVYPKVRSSNYCSRKPRPSRNSESLRYTSRSGIAYPCSHSLTAVCLNLGTCILVRPAHPLCQVQSHGPCGPQANSGRRTYGMCSAFALLRRSTHMWTSRRITSVTAETAQCHDYSVRVFMYSISKNIWAVLFT